ncbi:site-specific integrase [Ralstonia solanacearum]|uniref:site-specific integrase n=1 Tax=Ralstonia solanacearum TaxID=305 RepID=UPI001FF74E34|nr:site-specific integrase [Ralstonia solanacearum]MDB0528272.1 site-specific integrase [Ralstonia solanacearum]
MGTIIKRTGSKGIVTYQAKIRISGQKIISSTFLSHQDADDWLRATEPELKARSLEAAREQAHARLVEEFKERPRIVADLLHRNLQEETVRKKGAEAEVNHISSILKYPLARVHLENLTRRDIKEWMEQRLQHVAPSTVNRELNILNAVFKLAVHEWDVVLCKSVLISVRRPQNPPGRVRRLSQEEEAALRGAGEETRNPYIVSILELALETAMRRGEILDLQWERVSFAHRAIQLIETKNGTPRGVPLSRRAMEALLVLKRVAARHLGCDGEIMSGPVFPGLTINAFRLAFTRMVKRAGLENFRFHDLRHEATSRLFEKGLSQMEVAAITGHKDIRMLARYTHLQVKDLARKLDT